MYADSRRRFHPVSFSAALVVNGTIVGALLFIAPHVVRRITTPIPIIEIREQPVPPPIKPEPPKHETVKTTQPIEIDRVVETHQADPIVIDTKPKTGQQQVIGPETSEGNGVTNVVPEAKPLPFIEATIDPRCRNFQPDYPASEIRAEREGRVSVRVRIGTNGRVLAVEQLSATSPAFYEATRRQALRSWCFKPATRGGVAEESWKNMTIRFVLSGN